MCAASEWTLRNHRYTNLVSAVKVIAYGQYVHAYTQSIDPYALCVGRLPCSPSGTEPRCGGMVQSTLRGIRAALVWDDLFMEGGLGRGLAQNPLTTGFQAI